MIQPTLINILGTSILAVMFAFWYQPIQGIKLRILSRLPNIFSLVFTCSKCTGFVFGLMLFLDIFVAGVCALLGFIIGWFIDYINEWYE
jgi:hypothetical protein